MRLRPLIAQIDRRLNTNAEDSGIGDIPTMLSPSPAPKVNFARTSKFDSLEISLKLISSLLVLIAKRLPVTMPKSPLGILRSSTNSDVISPSHFCTFCPSGKSRFTGRFDPAPDRRIS